MDKLLHNVEVWNLVLLTVVLVCNADVFDDMSCHQGVVKCMEPITNYSKSMQEGGFVPYMSVDEFNTLCRKFEGVDACVKKVKCSDVFVKTYMGIDNAMEFMCEDQPQGYPSYARCVTHPVIHTEMQDCNKLVQTIQDPKQACSLYNKYLHCGYTTLEEHCTKDEAMWFEQVLVKSSQPVLDFHGCQIQRPSEKNSKKAGIIVGVAVAVIVIIVAAVGVAIYLYRKRQPVVKGYKPAKPGIV